MPDLGTLLFSGLAGVLSTLSPCVLPLLPIVIGGASAEHRLGPLALAGGLALSFTAIGLFVATIGFSIGLDGVFFRSLAGALMVAIGVVLMLPKAQLRFAAAAAPIQTYAEQRFGQRPTSGLGGQFALGLLLGAVWSPCVGPTLGAASVAAANGDNLGSVALTMAVFGLAAGAPLVALSAVSRQAMTRLRARMASGAGVGKLVLGAILVVVGLAVLSGWDKRIETALVELSPAWLTALTTRF